MRYHVLATDYDGTIAHHGDVDEHTLDGLRRFKASGRKLVLVTGRELEDLLRVFHHMELFELVVAENGAVLYRPTDQSITLLGERPPEGFAAALRERGVDPLSVGHIIVATWEPNETTVLQTIRDLGLELEIIFNKGAVMVLPPGVNKASGLAAALHHLGISPHNSVGVGDAENDHAFLSICECAVAVANALPALKERCDEVTPSPRGAGVVELIDQVLDDLASLRLSRHDVLLGNRDGDTAVRVAPQGANVLVAGPSSSGKSTLVSGLLERIVEQRYQALVIDPEGDYETFPDAIHLGTHDRAPTVAEVLDGLADPAHNVVANLLGLVLEDRPGFLRELLFGLDELRSRTGRPHRIVIDETHHLLPADMGRPGTGPAPDVDGLLMIAPHVGTIRPDALKAVDVVLALGDEPDKTMLDFSKSVGVEPPEIPATQLDRDHALGWWRHDDSPAFVVRYAPGAAERMRHIRKYAAGDVGDKSFYFQGPDGKLNLRAQNLQLFVQVGEGVDDATWLHHLRQGDYSRWFRAAIKDDVLASQAEEIERQYADDAATSRARIREAIERRYTPPA